MIAHLAGVPVEEILPAVTGAGTALLVARTWITLRVRRHREPRDRAYQPARRPTS